MPWLLMRLGKLDVCFVVWFWGELALDIAEDTLIQFIGKRISVRKTIYMDWQDYKLRKFKDEWN